MRTAALVASLMTLTGTGVLHAARPPATTPLKPTPAASKLLQALAKPVTADYKSHFPVWAAYPSSSANFYLPVLAGHCYWILGTGAEGVRDVDMYLYNAQDSQVAEDRAYSVQMKIHYCAEAAGSFRVELKLKRGKGEVAMQVFVRAAAVRKPLVPVDGRPLATTPTGSKPATESEKRASPADAKPVAAGNTAGASNSKRRSKGTASADKQTTKWPDGPRSM